MTNVSAGAAAPACSEGSMDTKTFLERVLPTSGEYAVCVIGARGTKHGWFPDVDKLASVAGGLSKQGENVYYAVASFDGQKHRRHENVQRLKALYLDIDCGDGKPYPDWKEGVKALGIFIKSSGLPQPMVVSSGRGLHVYWTLTEELTREEWQPLADGLKALTVKHGLQADPAVTADSARILRPVGTINPKNGATVMLLRDAPPVDPAVLAPFLSIEISKPQLQTSQPAQSSVMVAAMSGLKREYDPANATAIAAKCQQIKWGIDNPASVEEPFWYAMMGVAGFCAEPDQVAADWSQGYPGYDSDATVQKMRQWVGRATGPTMCSRFKMMRDTGCDGCPFAGKITSPAQLGVVYKEAEAPEAIEVKASSAAPLSYSLINNIPLPKPYKRTSTGIARTEDGVDKMVCHFDVIALSHGKDEGLGYEVSQFMWNRPHAGWSPLNMRLSILNQGDASKDFATAIGDQGILLTGKDQLKDFQVFLRSYAQQLQQLKSLSNIYSTMGWKEDGKYFVLGSTLMKKEQDGSIVTETSTLSEVLAKRDPGYGSKGNHNEWKRLVYSLGHANLSVHIFALGVSLSNILYEFTGIKGFTMSLYGPTGTGKTLCQLLMQSVYGDPTKLHYTSQATQNALFSRMSLHNCLPFTIDELTTWDPEDVVNQLYITSQGRDKDRLTKSAEMRDARTFSGVVTVSTNKSLASIVFASNTHTDALMARLLELKVTNHPLFDGNSDFGRKIHNFLANNYGHAGRMLIEEFMRMGPDKIKADIAEAMDRVPRLYNTSFSGTERFWHTGFVLAHYAMEVANRIGAVNVAWERHFNNVLMQLLDNRTVMLDNHKDNFDVLGEFSLDLAPKSVVVIHTDGFSPVMDNTRQPVGGEVRIRFDIMRKSSTDPFTDGTMMIDRSYFKRWLASKGVDYNTFMAEMALHGVDITPKGGKGTLTRDTGTRTPQIRIVLFDLKHPALAELLENASQPVPATP